MEIIGKSKIAGIGAYLPEQRVLSDDLMHEIGSTRFGTPVDYISKRIGIIERRISEANMFPSDMAIKAAEVALKDAGITPMDVDLIIYCGIDRDWQEPATSHRVQVEIGAKKSSCFDVTNACHGFMDGLSIANAFLTNGTANNVLVCTGEKPSRVLFEAIKILRDEKNKEAFKRMLGALTVGDAGGAMVIQRSNVETGEGLRWMQSYSEGEHANLCYYRHTHEGYDGQMLMREISLQIAKLHKKLIEKTYATLAWKPEEIDRIYCHQVGEKPHKALVSIANKSIDCAPITYPSFGNLTSATFPVNMHLNRPERGSKLLLMGTGSGLSVCQAGMVF
ncbi:ketoacyl-ACP synthase III [Teredinibacter turnerae]|uniref:ketoacyl-ACP synthase III n=1 Tax=Teredinibacter turnerae TaxID=2426 RepID=UPI00036039D4|nr:ketoacyl-ACP synthase III [Teredinibacter turnerae]